jgi:hypothetical protein
MRKIFLFFLFSLCAASARAATCTTLASGATQAAIQSALNGCGAGNTLAFSQGTYGPISSVVTIPCGVSMTGPVVPYSQTPSQLAIATIVAISGGISGGNWGFQINTPCVNSSTNPQTIQYLAWNGGQPTNGGGFIFINPGVSGVTITHDWLHGVNAPGGDGSFNAYLVMMGGGTTNAISNITITWNYFGTTNTVGDCAAAFIAGNPENDQGALCGGVAYQNAVSNVFVENNIMNSLEEPVKGAETPGTPSAGWNCNNVVVDFNNIQNYNRIGYEEQCFNPGQSTLLFQQFNNFGFRWGAQQSFDISAANGCENALAGAAGQCEAHTDFNVDVQSTNGGPGGTQADVGFEIWGQGPSGCTTHCTTANGNLFQGFLANSIIWSQAGNFQFNNNNFNISPEGGTGTSCVNPTGGFFNFEPSNKPALTPTCTGNTFSNAITGTTTSASPSISPAGGKVSVGQVVAIATTGTGRDTNTSNWCTTDGTTPIPGGAAVSLGNTATIMSTLTITGDVTLNCVGMWGAANQPYSYPSNFGYVPSSVVRAAFTTGGGPPPPPTPTPRTSGGLSAQGGISIQ